MGERLSLSDRAGRADIRAGTAVFALGRVDHIEAIYFADRAIRALGLARTALNAVIFTDNVCHG